MNYKDLTEYLKTRFPEYLNFYTFLRDDNKDKSITVYQIQGVGAENQLGGNIHRMFAAQIQLVYGKSISEGIEEIKKIAETIATEKNNTKTINGKEFLLIPRGSDENFLYLNTVGNGNHKFAIDVNVHY